MSNFHVKVRVQAVSDGTQRGADNGRCSRALKGRKPVFPNSFSRTNPLKMRLLVENDVICHVLLIFLRYFSHFAARGHRKLAAGFVKFPRSFRKCVGEPLLYKTASKGWGLHAPERSCNGRQSALIRLAKPPRIYLDASCWQAYIRTGLRIGFDPLLCSSIDGRLSSEA